MKTLRVRLSSSNEGKDYTVTCEPSGVQVHSSAEGIAGLRGDLHTALKSAFESQQYLPFPSALPEVSPEDFGVFDITLADPPYREEYCAKLMDMVEMTQKWCSAPDPEYRTVLIAYQLAARIDPSLLGRYVVNGQYALVNPDYVEPPSTRYPDSSLFDRTPKESPYPVSLFSEAYSTL